MVPAPFKGCCLWRHPDHSTPGGVHQQAEPCGSHGDSQNGAMGRGPGRGSIARNLCWRTWLSVPHISMN